MFMEYLMEPESVRKHTSLVQPPLGESAQKCTDTHTSLMRPGQTLAH